MKASQLKKAHKSRTIQFAALIAVLGVLESQYSLIEQHIPESYRGLIFIGISMVMAYLRFKTTAPVEDK